METARAISIAIIMVAACRVSSSGEQEVLARTKRGALRLYVSGSRTSREPVVVFEAGLGDASEAWRLVAAGTARSIEVVRYDRAGLGSSPASVGSRTATAIASELHDALVSAKIGPPYVLVSHSAGAWYATVFAAQHPSEVKGLVLVDPTPPKFFGDIGSLLDEHQRADFASSISKYEANASPGRRAEWQLRDQAAKEAEAAGLPQSVPIVVITAAGPQPGRTPTVARYWRDQHKRMAEATSKGRLVVANAGHYVQVEQPNLVIREIRRLLATLPGA